MEAKDEDRGLALDVACRITYLEAGGVSSSGFTEAFFFGGGGELTEREACER